MNLSKTSIVGRKTINENFNQQMTLLFSNLTGQWITIYCVKNIMLDNRGHKRYWRQYSTHFHGNYSIIKETDPHQTTLLLATSGQLLSSLSERNIEKKLFQKWAKKNFGGEQKSWHFKTLQMIIIMQVRWTVLPPALEHSILQKQKGRWLAANRTKKQKLGE